MKIAVFSKEKVSTIKLPNEVVGSFSFDISSSEQKIVNITSEEGKWILKQTSEIQIISGNQFVPRVVLTDNSFYTLRKKDNNYLLYTYSSNKVNLYKYSKDIAITIGNGNGASIDYNCQFLKTPITISFENNNIVLTKDASTLVYINKKILLQTSAVINYNDEIDIFGLQIKFYNETLLAINSIPGLMIGTDFSSHLTNFTFQDSEETKDIELEDIPLYSKNDYYSKSPRLRRMAEQKNYTLDPPPDVEQSNGEKMPMILVAGPMITMGMTSFVTLGTTLYGIFVQGNTVKSSIPSLIISGSMILSMFVWPLLTRLYNKRVQKKHMNSAVKKYADHLENLDKEISEERDKQRVILAENLSTIEECIKNIETKSMNFWDKRMDQSDFLLARVGIGMSNQTCCLTYNGEFSKKPKELEKKAQELVEKYKEMDNLPIGYSFYTNIITAVMGTEKKQINFINNILLQMLTYYSYDDLKIVIFTSESNESEWDYLKYLNHNFSDDKSIRFFASNQRSINSITEYLNVELNNRIEQSQGKDLLSKPHYLIITDDYDRIKRTKFIKTLVEMDNKLGFSMIIAENKLAKLPSKCNNFITLGNKDSEILRNTYETQEHIIFHDEIHYDLDMNKITKPLANIPIEFESSSRSMPELVDFLEMEKVGNVEQLNILNRWRGNDSINSLKAEVGIDENGDLLFLDIHEKYHGPHGLIAGMTGSGKSEFIITYILSLAINYSPEDVAFILIDYKGGGLAYAFENKQKGISLPHLAGTITNLDKSEMDRTLVSINSEIKRRQRIFNEARDSLGESTIDIYKYQRFYKEGKLSLPVPHLLIICDEFAELKSQQPEFMDNLISVARIGRSLGIHLILATQKPSGVVNDQIWSNSKFRVCLKVQDESDSREMLKRGDAANIKEVGRFYLQVGYDEYFALGQSAWCGAKYYPADEYIEKKDRSIDFIDENGFKIKSIQGNTNKKGPAQGEQIAAIMNSIIELSEQTNIKADKLWLDNIPPVILVDDLFAKYNLPITPYNVEGIIGEYDAPELQEQGLVKYNYVKDGNAIIYGVDGTEREMIINSLIYSTAKYHSASEIEFYIVDYGSESFTKFEGLPQVGGVVLSNEEEKFSNLLKMISTDLKNRKQILSKFGGEFENYISQSEEKLPVKVIVLNNYDSIYENNQKLYDILPELIRDSERYGIIFVFTASSVTSVPNKLAGSCRNKYALKLSDNMDYTTVFDTRVKISLRNYNGRGFIKNDEIHEFQTASIVDNQSILNDFINAFTDNQISMNQVFADKIPTLPELITNKDIVFEGMNMSDLPIGIYKQSLELCKYDFTQTIGTIITSNKLSNMANYVKGLLSVIKTIPGSISIVFDYTSELNLDKNKYPNYYNVDLENIVDKVAQYIENLKMKNTSISGVIMIYGVSKFVSKVGNEKMKNLVSKIKEYEKLPLIVIESSSKISQFMYEDWFKDNFSSNDGIWVGRGIANQNAIRIASITKEMTLDLTNDMGYVITENMCTLCKLVGVDNGGNSNE